MLWHPVPCSSSMISASFWTDISFPSPRWLMVQFWQKMHPRLQRLKKMVPEPNLPTRGLSSPKWGPQLDTTGLSETPQKPSSPAVLSTPHLLGQRVQFLRSSSASKTFRSKTSGDNVRHAV